MSEAEGSAAEGSPPVAADPSAADPAAADPVVADPFAQPPVSEPVVPSPATIAPPAPPAPAAPAAAIPPPYARLAALVAPPLVPGDDVVPPALPAEPPPPPPAVQSTRRLVGASFDLLTQSTADMRRASFYVGAIVLGTAGPFALATLAVLVFRDTHPAFTDDLGDTPTGGWYALSGIVAGLGVLVALVESRNVVVALLGSRYADRPIDVRAALARSRMSFWPTIAAYIIVSIPVSIATQVVNDFVTGLLNGSEAASFAVGVVVGVLIRAPLTYVLAGIVLGDVGPVESTRRSIRVFRARKAAAALVALFESVVFLLIIIGIGAALEVVLQVVDALGLGTDSGPIGLALVAAGISIGVFALGTLIFTSVAISIAPQAVMFVGLTRATIGLDHVRPGGDHDPAIARRGRRRFHAITLPMWTGVGLGLIGLVGTLASLPV